jgi:hypothetical protein
MLSYRKGTFSEGTWDCTPNPQGCCDAIVNRMPMSLTLPACEGRLSSSSCSHSYFPGWTAAHHQEHPCREQEGESGGQQQDTNVCLQELKHQ